jgi:hypothetical protein
MRRLPEFGHLDQGAILPSAGVFAVGRLNANCLTGGGSAKTLLVSLGPEGAPAPGFGFAGFRSLGSGEAPTATVAPSGKILLLGQPRVRRQTRDDHVSRRSHVSVMRLLPDGGPDPGFGHLGEIDLAGPADVRVATVVVDHRERVIFAGLATPPVKKKQPRRTSFLVGRINAPSGIDRRFGHRGSLTTGFGPKANSRATQVAIDTRGRILVGGPVSTPSLATGGGWALARYLSR